MKILFMGTPDFAARILSTIIDSGQHNVLAAVSQPDRPKGRGNKLAPTPVKALAQENGIPVFQPEKIRDSRFAEELAALEADIFVVAAYGRILPQSLLDMPQFGCVNVHASLLPKLRGAAPIQRAIMTGEAVTGITIQKMAKGVDTGDMILSHEIPIQETDTYGTLHDNLAEAGGTAILRALELIERGEAVYVKQDDDKATHAAMILPGDEVISWTDAAIDVTRRIRALNPAPGAYFSWNSQKIKVWEAEVADNSYDDAQIGAIAEINKRGFVVKTARGAVLLTSVQPFGGKRMGAADFLRGRKADVGEILE